MEVERIHDTLMELYPLASLDGSTNIMWETLDTEVYLNMSGRSEPHLVLEYKKFNFTKRFNDLPEEHDELIETVRKLTLNFARDMEIAEESARDFQKVGYSLNLNSDELINLFQKIYWRI